MEELLFDTPVPQLRNSNQEEKSSPSMFVGNKTADPKKQKRCYWSLEETQFLQSQVESGTRWCMLAKNWPSDFPTRTAQQLRDRCRNMKLIDTFNTSRKRKVTEEFKEKKESKKRPKTQVKKQDQENDENENESQEEDEETEQETEVEDSEQELVGSSDEEEEVISHSKIAQVKQTTFLLKSNGGHFSESRLWNGFTKAIQLAG
jgi:cobalamin biosynthesis protein CobT